MKRIVFWGALFSIAIIILLPLAIDWLIIGNKIPSNISNSDWVGFLGSYIGAVVGAIVSIIGIAVTIHFTKSQIQLAKAQYEEEKRLNYIPILDFEIKNIVEGAEDDSVIMDVEYTLKENGPFSLQTVEFNICNIGLGAALNLEYGMKLNGQEQDGTFWISGRQTLKSQNSTIQRISFHIPESEQVKITLIVYYQDILGNKYRKTIDIIVDSNDSFSKMVFFIINQDKGVLCSKSESKRYYVVGPMRDDADKKNTI